MQMYRTLLLLYFLFCCCIVEGQNLVPNPSFEDTVICPNHGGNIDQATGWINCGASPDYYNACANSSFPAIGVPYGLYSGYQLAFDGNAYGALLTLSIPNSGREFIGTHLTQPLIIGTKYYVSAYIVSGIYKCSSNNFGFKFFTNISYNYLNPPPIDNLSHVHSTIIISDSVNWTQISGSFIADSAYQYLVIGNFYSNQNTDTMNCHTNSDGTYYLIDEVCVSADSLTCNGIIGIEEQQNTNSQIQIYPNPTTSTFTLHCPSSMVNGQVTIFNSLGEKIYQSIINSPSTIVNLNASPGVYLLKTDGEDAFVRKVILY